MSSGTDFDEAYFRDLGFSVVQFARIENLILGVLLQANPPMQTTATKFLRDRLSNTFGARVAELRRFLEGLEDFSEYEDDLKELEKGKEIRDFIVHGLWKPIGDGHYRCIMYNRRGQSIEQPVNGPMLRETATATAGSFQRLLNRLVARGIVEKAIPLSSLDTVL